MRHSSIPSAQLVVQHCKAKKIKNIVISPGSRNAPLTIDFTEDPYFSCFSIIDERSAAFFALGIAQQLREPVAVVCTSGSALLNYYPAVAEAFYSCIPIIVISADRPVYKIDVGDGQTIRQDNVFHRHIGYSANLKQDVIHAQERVQRYAPEWLSSGSIESIQKSVKQHNDTELNSALNTVIQMKLPVHINVPLEEPLYNTTPNTTIQVIAVPLENKKALDLGDIDSYVDLWNASAKKMVLVGVSPPNMVEQHFLDKLATDPSVIVLTETTSNLHHPNFFPSIDSIVAPIEKSKDREKLFKKLRPQILLTFGGLIVSKKIKAFLREYKPEHHWHIDDLKAYDTFFSLSHHFQLGINVFFERFLHNVQGRDSGYFAHWNDKRTSYELKRKSYLQQIPFSDMLAFDHLAKSVPKGYQVQLANSSAVRYAQLFDMDESLRIFCNRGTSGIDGSTSTAIGASLFCDSPTVLITGDLSFFYDSNGLWNNYLRPDFRIILINNGGGGIFRILPGQEDTQNFETFFETTHNQNAAHLSIQYGLEHELISDEEGLANSLKTFYDPSNGPKILEIATPRLLNNKILLGYFDFISSTEY